MQHPGQLERMGTGRGADALDGGDVRSVLHAFHPGGAGADDFAVHEDAARAALTLRFNIRYLQAYKRITANINAPQIYTALKTISV